MQITAMSTPRATDSLTRRLDGLGDAAERGFPAIWAPQMPAMAGLSAWDPLVALALAGQRWPHVQLGTAVSIAYGQHPFVLAKQAATVSASAPGRLTLGLGLSHPQVVEAMGYRYERPVAFLAEYLDALLPALRGAAVDHRGDVLTAVGVLELPDAPMPSVVLAALGPRMLRLAGARSDGTVTSFAGPRTLADHVVPTVNAAAADAGRPAPRVIASLPVQLTADADSARADIDETFGGAAQLPSYRAMFAREGVTGPGAVGVLGDEAAVAAGLRRLADAGVTEFIAWPGGDAEAQRRTLNFLADYRR